MSRLKISVFWTNHKNKARKIKQICSIIIIFILFINFLYLLENISNSNRENFFVEDDIEQDNIITPKSADIGYLFQDPFKSNFDKIWQFFKNKYKSELELEIDTYYREGNSVGTIIDDKIYPLDNLLLYKSLLKENTNASTTFDNYLKLRNSILWYSGDISQYKYGFIRSFDNSTNKIYDDDRYLIDNLMPIFLLIENIDEEITSLNNGGQYPVDSINEIFNLINSSEFWDSTNGGFYHHNSTTDKYTESNLYAILANLEIHKLYKKLEPYIDTTIMNRAYELANITMDKLLTEIWDTAHGGFRYYALENWNEGSVGSNYKYLHVNALGIITLIEYWKVIGMQNDNYINLAEYLFNKLDEEMWDSDAYYYSLDRFWSISAPDYKKDLEANSIMLTACLKLFETTANITYYNRAWELHQTFENSFYDSSVNAYKSSIESPVDNNKELYANLKLSEAYLYGFDIYNSTVVKASFNVSDMIPDYIFNEDTMNITSTYAFEKNIEFFNQSTEMYEIKTIQYNIDSADISYVFKFPNGTFLEKRNRQIIDDSITLLYNINESIPIGNGYYLYIYANTSIFSTAITVKRYNIISGLILNEILGLPSTLYQGPTLNVILQINNTRKEDVSLTVSMEGEDILNETQSIYFPSMILTNVTFNLTAVLDAKLGFHNLRFEFKEDQILYLQIIRLITIGNSFDYTNFIHDSSVSRGGIINVLFNVINFLPNSSQILNITFTGEHLDHKITDEIHLAKNEIRTLYYSIPIINDIIADETEIEMNIKKGETLFYTNSFTVKIIEKLEILSVSFPERVPQGEYAYFIIKIQNNQKVSESFSLYVNGERIETNKNGLGPGENIIIAKVLPTINPYDFELKTYIFTLKDSTDNTFAKYYFKVEIEITPFNLVVFYLLPIIIPIAIVLFYKNKEIKHKLLRR